MLIDIQDVIMQRLGQLEEDGADEDEMEFEILTQDNLGIIQFFDDDVLLGTEFVETHVSLQREDLLDDYLDAYEDGFVTIIVPDDAYFETVEHIKNELDEAADIYSYSALGIRPTPMAS